MLAGEGCMQASDGLIQAGDEVQERVQKDKVLSKEF